MVNPEAKVIKAPFLVLRFQNIPERKQTRIGGVIYARVDCKYVHKFSKYCI